MEQKGVVIGEAFAKATYAPFTFSIHVRPHVWATVSTTNHIGPGRPSTKSLGRLYPEAEVSADPPRHVYETMTGHHCN